MKKIVFLSLNLLLTGISGFAQNLNFTLANPQPNLLEVYAGTYASGDIDGDGDKDLFMTGITPGMFTKLYLNDGFGNFTEITTSTFPKSGTSQAILKDLDKDGDLDLFFSGRNELNQKFTKIYRNNGTGVFTQVINNALPNFIKGAAIDDVDNDGDQDIAISAEITSSNYKADVYLNDGNAVFTAQGSTVFTPVSGALAFIDIENDGDKDLIISGTNVNNASSTKLYQNNGSGIFTLNTTAIFDSIGGKGADIDVVDTDNDGDLDVLVNGSIKNFLYTNNGSGVFTKISTTLQQTQSGNNAFADLDNDGDQDLLIIGSQQGGGANIFNILYENKGNNVFMPTDTLGGEYIAECIIEDFNGDGKKDIIMQGFVNKTSVYWNTSTISPLGVSNQAISNNLVTLFPNPTNNVLNFSAENTIENLTIYSLSGAEILSSQVNSKYFSLNISNLSSGIYFAKVNSKSKTEYIKLRKF